MKKELIYSLYDRLWHWTQAGATVILLLTGFEISFPLFFSITGFHNAVSIHNIAGLVLVGNALLALFYNLTSGLVHRYVPEFEEFNSSGIHHARYYLWEIFRGIDRSLEKTPEKQSLPLQKITYFGLMNVLLPMMILTGVLKLSAVYDPAIMEYAGGLTVLGPLHRLGAWLFLSYLIVHLYMITLGHKATTNLKTMITGYERVHQSPDEDNHLSKAKPDSNVQ